MHEHRQIHVPPKELAALRLLLQRAGQLVTPQQLQETLWGDVHVTADSVPRCISSLRARLESDECIQTVYKRGYRMYWPVQKDSDLLEPPLPRLAIMPFKCGPGVSEHLGRAVAEEATARLTAIQPPVYSMLARDSVFMLASRGLNAQQVGETLGADLVLTGKLQPLPAHFRLRLEMVRVHEGTQIWVEDVLVARERAAGLEGELVERLLFRTNGTVLHGREGTSMNVDAYDTFLRGRYEWQTLERHRMQDAMRHLHRAIELDPQFTQAGVELVRACMAQELFGYVSPALAAEQVRRIAKGVAEDCDERTAILPALGWMAFHVDRDLAMALRCFVASAQLSPDSWRSRIRALFAAGRHRFDDAAELLLEALELDPFSAWMNAGLAWVYHLGGRAADSLRQIDRCLELCPDHTAAQLYGGMILAYQGDADRALGLTRELMRHAPQFDMAMAVHAYALACKGERQDAAEWLERLQWVGRERYVMRSFAAAAFLALGDRDGAMTELRAADEDRCPWFPQMLADPRLAGLQELPEFRAMQARLDAMEAAAALPQEAECLGDFGQVNR